MILYDQKVVEILLEIEELAEVNVKLETLMLSSTRSHCRDATRL